MYKYEHEEKCEVCWQKFIFTKMFWIKQKLCCFKCSMEKLRNEDSYPRRGNNTQRKIIGWHNCSALL